jgi:hypothetical protein|nr:MAG TPA: hypothetical protein [Caudoviricetes sp.]
MYTLKAKTCFYDKEHPGRMLHPGELLITKDEERVKRLQELNFAEVVTVDQPEAPKEEPVKEAVEAPAEAQNEAPAEEAAEQAAEAEAKEPEEVAEVVTVGSESYPVAVVKKALNAIGVKTAANAGLKAVSKKVSELSEEQAQELAKVLTK